MGGHVSAVSTLNAKLELDDTPCYDLPHPAPGKRKLNDQALKCQSVTVSARLPSPRVLASSARRLYYGILLTMINERIKLRLLTKIMRALRAFLTI